MKFTSFTRRIWQLFGSTADKRADYLWKLYHKAATTKCEGKYLDIGCGLGQNAIVFGQDCQSIHCLDIDNENVTECQATFRLKGINKVSFYQGDAQALPFRAAIFDRVSMISVIEHVASQEHAVQEASRVLKPRGELILQVPDKYFFVDLHTGIPFLHCLPLSIRRQLLAKLGYRGLGNVMKVKVPSKTKLFNLLIHAKFSKVRVLKVIYPSELIMPQLKPVYSAFYLFGIFKLVPFGFLFVADKEEANIGNLAVRRPAFQTE